MRAYLCHDDLCRVVVDGAIDCHAVAVEGLPDEAVRRHLEVRELRERSDGDVQALRAARRGGKDVGSMRCGRLPRWRGTV